jgi:acylphosphatase
MTVNNPNEPKRVHIWVSGRVQGVGFRAFVVDQFHLCGVKGWVRNQGYDQVEAVAEGTEEALKRFAGAVGAGPRAARVEESRVEWEIPSGEFTGVDVRSSR